MILRAACSARFGISWRGKYECKQIQSKQNNAKQMRSKLYAGNVLTHIPSETVSRLSLHGESRPEGGSLRWAGSQDQ